MDSQTSKLILLEYQRDKRLESKYYDMTFVR